MEMPAAFDFQQLSLAAFDNTFGGKPWAIPSPALICTLFFPLPVASHFSRIQDFEAGCMPSSAASSGRFNPGLHLQNTT